MLLMGASGAALGQTAGSAPSSNAAAAGEETPAQVRADESKDPRLKALSASDQKAYLDEGASSIQYCSNDVVLNGFYSCSCFSKAVFDERMKTIGQTVRVAGRTQATPFVNLVAKLDYSACVAPAKIPAYATDRTQAILKPDPTVSAAQRDQISACVSTELTTKFVAKPYPDMSAINGYFNSALIPCREKIDTGNSAASSPGNPPTTPTQNSGGAPAPAARAPIPTTARAPIPAPKTGFMGRLSSAVNRANGAIEKTTETHLATTPVTSQPANAGAHSSATTPATTTNQVLKANDALYMAVIRDDAVGCANAIAQGAQVNSLDRGDTMLITAAREGLPVTQCLVDHGADINGQVTERGNPMTPVWASVEAKHFDVMDYLVEKGVPVNSTNTTNDQESLLMFAIGEGTLKDVEFLVEHGADVNYVRQGVHGPENALTFSTGLHHGDETAYLQAHGAHQ
jgi:hypothetical protein